LVRRLEDPSLAMACDGDSLEWLSDYVVSVLKSPTWVLPMCQFMDDRCFLFDDREECDLECTQCHNDFRQFVNDLFVSHLLEVSVTPEMFERFCENGLASNSGLHRTLVQQLLSVDDFLTFKAMMAKHNAELCCEVGCGEPSEVGSPTRSVADAVVQSSILQGVEASTDEWRFYDSSTHFSGRDERMEEAELEQAIAISLQLEEERLRQIAMEEAAAVPALPASAGFLSAPLHRPPRLNVPAVMPHVVQMDPLSPHKVRSGAWGFTSMPYMAVPPQLPQDYVVQEPVPEAVPVPEPAPLPPSAGFTSSPLCYLPPKPFMHEEGVPAQVEAPALAPVETQGTVEGMTLNLNLWKERAAIAIKQPSMASPAMSRDASPLLRPSRRQFETPLPHGPTEEELRVRREHLQRQRAALMQKRAQERSAALAQFNSARSGPSAAAAFVDSSFSGVDMVAAGRRMVAELTPGAVMAAPGTHQLQDTQVAAEHMRQALTLQLRQTLLKSIGSDANTLGNQLSQLESMKQQSNRNPSWNA